MRRAEFEMRHRQMMSGHGGGQPSRQSFMKQQPPPPPPPPAPASPVLAPPSAYPNERIGPMSQQVAAAYQAGLAAASGGQSGPPSLSNSPNVIYPISAAQPATNLHPAVPAGTLADPTYLLPPKCHHEDCHKSYRKRLKVAKQTQACPNCLSLTNPMGHSFSASSSRGGPDEHPSSAENTPQTRSLAGSQEDLHSLGSNSVGGGHGSGMMGGMVQQQQMIQQHLQRLAASQTQQKHSQQKLLAQLRNQPPGSAHPQFSPLQQPQVGSGSSSAPSSFKRPSGSYMGAYPTPQSAPAPHPSSSSRSYHHGNSARTSHRQSKVVPSAPASAVASPASESSLEDFDDPARPLGGQGFDFTPLTSPVLGSMKSMSLFPHGQAPPGPHYNDHPHSYRHGPHAPHLHAGGGFTAPVSLSGTPLNSRGPSRAGSPEHHREGHVVAGTGKHGGLTSHMARDAKYKTHPYGHGHHSIPPGSASSTHAHSRSSAAASRNGGASPPPRLPRAHSTSQVSAQGHPGWHTAPTAGGSGSAGMAGGKSSVEDILNKAPMTVERTLPP